MPRICTVCTHPEKTEIDQALLSGQPFRKVAERFGTSTSALFRHKSNDIPVALMKAQEAQEISYGDDLFSQVKDLNNRTLRILAQAEAAGDPRVALAAIRAARSSEAIIFSSYLSSTLPAPSSSSPNKLSSSLIELSGPQRISSVSLAQPSSQPVCLAFLQTGIEVEKFLRRLRFSCFPALQWLALIHVFPLVTPSINRFLIGRRRLW